LAFAFPPFPFAVFGVAGVGEIDLAATAAFLVFGAGGGLGALALFDLPVFGAGAVFAACLATTLLFCML
jgi:hypothetical protein